MVLEDYKLELKLRIDYSELDTYKHVNNVAFIKYMQSARVNFWEISGLYKLHAETNKGPMLVSTKCDFKNQLRYPGNVTVKTKVSHIGNSSFSLEHVILDDDNTICAIGKDVAVCFDFNSQQTFAIPQWLRKAMEAYT